MRLGILLNLREALLTTLLVLVILTPNSSQCEAGLWISQGRYPPVSYEIVLVKGKMPFERLKAFLSHWQVSRKIFVRLLCQFLASCLLAWLNILGWLIQQTSPNPKIPIQGGFIWSRPVCAATLEVKMVVSLIPTVTSQAVRVEKAASIEKMPLTRDSSVHPVIVSSQNRPNRTSRRVELLNTNKALDESNIIVEPQLCKDFTTLSEVTEQQNDPFITKTSNYKTKVRYEAAVETTMRSFYQTLNEKDKRRYAAVEAIKLGHGGQSYIAQILGLSRKTISKGIKEIKNGLVKEERIRKKGAGRKPYTHQYPDIDDKFLDVLKHYTAGDPMKEEIRWTNLTVREIGERLEEKHGIKVSKTVVKQLLKKHDFRRRKAQKRCTMKPVALRNEQFENIARLKQEYEATGNPVISMDTKKKEHLGNYYRDGYLYTREEVQTWDHDFISMAYGVIIPHSFFDERKKKGHINIGTSKDTTEFACDSLKLWWNKYGKEDYPNATSILLLCDGGGSNSSRYYIFKEDLQKLANEIGIEIRIAHYPPYCSKYNPIEHRFFPHVTRACQGVVLETHEITKELMEKTSTKTGLTTTVEIIDKTYQTGRKYAPDFKDNMPIIFDDYLGNWNYRAVPNGNLI